jgi:hypothetical protein
LTQLYNSVSWVYQRLTRGVSVSRKKLPRWSVRFELAPENADDVRVHEHVLSLAESNGASAWIRAALVAALDSGVKQPPVSAAWKIGAGANGKAELIEAEKPSPVIENPLSTVVQTDEDNDTVEQPLNNSGATVSRQPRSDVKSSSEIVRERKDAAQQRHPLPPMPPMRKG